MPRADKRPRGLDQGSEVSREGAPARVVHLGRPTLSNEELLDRALEVFLDQGFERASIEMIASVAGMAKRTVYARYADKETLFRAALTRAIDSWIVPVERLRRCESDDLEETLVRIGQVLMGNIMTRRGMQLLRLTNAVSGRMPQIAAYNVQRGTQPTLDYLGDLFARSMANDQPAAVVTPAEAATAFLHLIVGGPASMAAWGVPFDRAAISSHIGSSVKLFLQGFLPREDAAKERAENAHLRRLLTDALIENEALILRNGT